LRGDGLPRDIEEGREFVDIFGGGLGLAVEEGGDSNFLAAEVRGDGGEGEIFGGLGVEEGLGVGGEAGGDGGLGG